MVAKDAVDRAVAVARGVVSLEVDVISALKQAHQRNDDDPQGVEEVDVLRHEAEEVSQLGNLHFIHQCVGEGHVDPNDKSFAVAWVLEPCTPFETEVLIAQVYLELVAIVDHIGWGHEVERPPTDASPTLCNWWVHHLHASQSHENDKNNKNK